MTAPVPAKWFIQLKGIIKGPFNNENLVRALQDLGEDNYQSALVWKRGLSDWIKANQWQRADQQISALLKASSTPVAPAPPTSKDSPKAKSPPPPQQTPASSVPKPIQVAQEPDEHTKTSIDNDLFEKTFNQAFTDNVFYRIQVNFVDQPLMSKNELLQLIAKTDDLSTISIQDAKSKEWKEIYAFPDLVEKFGISRRKSQRVPILAQFTGKSNKSKNVSYRVITISEGGMGFTENYELKIGDEVDGQISSPHFFQPINVKADVIYAGLDGYIGLKFSSVTDETRAAIIEYIKKFGKSQKS
jgi:hypothetical protein